MQSLDTTYSGLKPDSIPPSEVAVHLDFLGSIIKFIFSGLTLMSISVIICGKFLAQRIRLPVSSKQLFKIPIPGIFEIGATDDEVILGFTGLIITLLVTGSLFGRNAHQFVIDRFGFDVGHFTSLCVLSSFVTVIWSFTLFLVLGVKTKGALEDVATQHERLISSVTHRTDKED